MKLFHGTSLGLPLNCQSSLRFGETEIHLHDSLGLAAGAILENRLICADLTKDAGGRLVLTAERTPADDRALVVVDLGLHASGWVDYFTVRPNREFVRVLRPHTTHASDFPLSAQRYHALLVLSEGTAVNLTETAVIRPLLGRLRRRLGGNPKSVMRFNRYRFALENGLVSLVERHSFS